MNNVKYFSFSVVLFLGFLLFSTSSATAGIVNGDFSQENAGEWVISGTGDVDIFSDIAAGGNGFAVLYTENEEQASFSILSQEIVLSELPENQNKLSFDIVMLKPGGEDTETDIFTATFGTEERSITSDFAGESYYENVVLDLAGFTPGTYSLTFQLANYPDGVPAAVFIDNVQFVPIPDTLILGIIGIFSAIALWKWKVYRVARI